MSAHKKWKKILALVLVLSLMVGILWTPAMAVAENGDGENTEQGGDPVDTLQEGGDNGNLGTGDEPNGGSGTDGLPLNGESDMEDEVPFDEADASIGAKNYRTLQDALDHVQDNEVITINRNLSNVSASIDAGERNITIDLNGKVLTAGTEDVLTVTIQKGKTITVKNGTITGGESGSPTGRALVFENVKTVDSGGHVVDELLPLVGGNIVLTGVTVTNMNSTGEGVGLCIEGNKIDSLTMERCCFTNNTFGGSVVRAMGNGDYNTVGMTITNCSFTGNTSTSSNSNTVYLSTSKAKIDGCTFSNNTAGQTGGIYLGSMAGNMSGTSFTDNAAETVGGLYIFVSESSVNASSCVMTLDDCTFLRNHANEIENGERVYSAGAIVMVGIKGRTNINTTQIKENIANSGAGGVCIDQSCNFKDAIITGNTVNSEDIYAAGGIKLVSGSFQFDKKSTRSTEYAVYDNEPCDVVSIEKINGVGLIAASAMKAVGQDFSDYAWKNMLSEGPELFEGKINQSSWYGPSGNTLFTTLRVKAEKKTVATTGSLKVTLVVEGLDEVNSKKFQICIPGTEKQFYAMQNNETLVFTDLKPGTYEITENGDANKFPSYIYTATGFGTVDVIASDTPTSVTIKLSYTKMGLLVIKNTVVGIPSYYHPKINFKFSITDSNGETTSYSLYGAENSVSLLTGEYTVRLDTIEFDGYKHVNAGVEQTVSVVNGEETTVELTSIFEPVDCEAKIGEVPYPTLEDALDAAQPNDTIILLENVTVESTCMIPNTITLDLSGNTLTGDVEVDDGGSMTLNGGTVAGNVTVQSKGTLKADGTVGKAIVVAAADSFVTLTKEEGPYNVELNAYGASVTMSPDAYAPKITITLGEDAYNHYLDQYKLGSASWTLVQGASSAANVTLTNAGASGKKPVVVAESGKLILSIQKIIDHNAEIYLDGVNGNDTNNGTYAEPVKSFAEAKRLMQESGAAKIYIIGTVTVSDTQSWDLDNGERGIGMLVRFAGDGNAKHPAFTGDLIEVTGTLTLANIILDGSGTGTGLFPLGSAGVSLPEGTYVCTGALVKVFGGTLNIEEGATLQNNVKNGDGSEEWGEKVAGAGVFADNGAKVNMNGGEISQNTATLGGGIALYHKSTFTMSGGTIKNNKADERPANRDNKRPEKTEEWPMPFTSQTACLPENLVSG